MFSCSRLSQYLHFTVDTRAARYEEKRDNVVECRDTCSK